MINYVIINGVNSNTKNGLGINELPPITKPSMRTQTEEIDGRDGDIITKLGYSAYDKTITIGLFGTGYDVNDIISFFTSEGTITFSNEPDKYYKFTMLEQIDVESLLRFKTASITFHCQPFKYPLEEEPLEIEYEYVNGEGESITLDNTGEATLNLSLKGNTSQTGEPTPSSPIPINVVSGDNEVVVCGKNLLNPTDFINAWVSSATGDINNDNTNYLSNYIEIDKDTTYYLKSKVSFYKLSFVYYDSSKTYISKQNNSGGYSSVTPTIPANAKYVRLEINYDNATTMMSSIITNNEVGFTIGNQPYEPYQSQTYPINLGVENLFDKDNPNQINCSINSTQVSDSGVGKSIYIPITSGETYTISKIASSRFRVGTTATTPANNVSTIDYKESDSATSITINTSSTAKYLCVYCYSSSSDTLTLQEILNSIQIEVGTKANSYSPYGQTPIKMRGIGTYEDYFVRNSGKNLFDESLLTGITMNGITWSTENNKIKISGTSTSTYSQSGNTSINLQKGTYYFVKSGTTSLTYNAWLYNRDGTLIANTKLNNPFTINETATRIVLFVEGLTNGTNYNQTMNFQISKSNDNYEPFGSGKWCKYNAIGNVVLDGSENWNRSINNNIARFELNNIDYKKGGDFHINLMPLFSNYFTLYDFTNVYDGTKTGCAYWWSSSTKILLFGFQDDRTLETFKTWLSTHNTTLDYVLATPYLSLIEDETLISQLDNIQNAMSYEGQTNVMQVNNDKPFIISAKALEQGSDEVVVNNIGNATSKPLIALEGTGNINIYLDGTQVLQANVVDKMNIDIDKLEAYNPDTSALLNRQVTGNYNSMTLPSGNSTIKIDGNLTSATITNYTRWL